MKRPPAILLVLVCLLAVACAASAQQTPRKSVLAGTWYPGSAGALRAMIGGFLAKADPAPPPGDVVALVAPHAGYVFSGQTAAFAYKLLVGRSFDVVAVIAPSHHLAFDGVSVYDRGGYETPLGTVPLDQEAVSRLLAVHPAARFLPEAHAKEHALEIQLPFLQTVLPGAKLLPIVMGSQDFASCQTLAAALAETLKGRKALIVASSDLSHFHSRQQAAVLDARLMDRTAAFDPGGLAQSLASGQCEACGGGPIIATMLAASRLGANAAAVLKYADSADANGDQDQVVGYMAAVFFAGKP